MRAREPAIVAVIIRLQAAKHARSILARRAAANEPPRESGRPMIAVIAIAAPPAWSGSVGSDPSASGRREPPGRSLTSHFGARRQTGRPNITSSSPMNSRRRFGASRPTELWRHVIASSARLGSHVGGGARARARATFREIARIQNTIARLLLSFGRHTFAGGSFSPADQPAGRLWAVFEAPREK